MSVTKSGEDAPIDVDNWLSLVEKQLELVGQKASLNEETGYAQWGELIPHFDAVSRIAGIAEGQKDDEAIKCTYDREVTVCAELITRNFGLVKEYAVVEGKKGFPLSIVVVAHEPFQLPSEQWNSVKVLRRVRNVNKFPVRRNVIPVAVDFGDGEGASQYCGANRYPIPPISGSPTQDDVERLRAALIRHYALYLTLLGRIAMMSDFYGEKDFRIRLIDKRLESFQDRMPARNRLDWLTGASVHVPDGGRLCKFNFFDLTGGVFGVNVPLLEEEAELPCWRLKCVLANHFEMNNVSVLLDDNLVASEDMIPVADCIRPDPLYRVITSPVSDRTTADTVKAYLDALCGNFIREDDNDNGAVPENNDDAGSNSSVGTTMTLDHDVRSKFEILAACCRADFIENGSGVFKAVQGCETDGLREKMDSAISTMIAGSVAYETDAEKAEHWSAEEYCVKDYHPGSNNVVLDIVHPSMFPRITDVAPRSKQDRDSWGRDFESSRFQWLPTSFVVDQQGTCKISGSVPNLPTAHALAVVPLLEQLFSRAVPLLERTGAAITGRRVQVITKIVDYELQPFQVYPDGAWHVEGMSHEHIWAACVCVIHKDADLEGGFLRFQREFTKEENDNVRYNAGQHEDRTAQQTRDIETGRVPLGRCALNQGDMVVFPNSHVHQLSGIANRSSEDRRRRVVVFWLVNPQQRIPAEHVSHAPKRSYLEALGDRLKLMEERKRSKQNFNVREVSLCEH